MLPSSLVQSNASEFKHYKSTAKTLVDDVSFKPTAADSIINDLDTRIGKVILQCLTDIHLK